MVYLWSYYFRSKNNNGVSECGDHCRQRRRDLELELQQLRREMKSGEDRVRSMDVEIQHLRRSQQNTPPQHQIQQQQQPQQQQQQQQQQPQHQQQQQQHNVETELLVSALSALQDKTAHLETSLSAETRIKLDLFSALGEAKRQLEHRESKR